MNRRSWFGTIAGALLALFSPRPPAKALPAWGVEHPKVPAVYRSDDPCSGYEVLDTGETLLERSGTFFVDGPLPPGDFFLSRLSRLLPWPDVPRGHYVTSRSFWWTRGGPHPELRWRQVCLSCPPGLEENCRPRRRGRDLAVFFKKDGGVYRFAYHGPVIKYPPRA